MKAIVACSAALLMMSSNGTAQTEPKKGTMTVQEAIRQLAKNGVANGAGPPESPDKAAKTMRAFVHCIMADTSKPGAMLALLPGSDEELNFARRFATKRAGCLDGGALRFGALILRGGIAEGMWRRDFDSVGGGARHLPVPVYKMPVSAEMASLPSRVQGALELQTLSSCVVGRAPATVSALLAAETTSDAESADWQALMGDLKTCIDPTKSIKITKFQLRGTLAEAAYRISAKPYEVAVMNDNPARDDLALHATSGAIGI